MTTPDNADRAEWARAAVIEFRNVCSGSPLDDQEGWEEACGDLVANLMHLIASEGLDPMDVLACGVRCFMDERDYPPDGWAPANKPAYCLLETWRGPSKPSGLSVAVQQYMDDCEQSKKEEQGS